MSELIDLTGQQFGSLLVIERDFSYNINKITNKQDTVYWKCLCQNCGTIKTVASKHLRFGRTKTCGCGRKLDLTNQRFGKLIALYPTDKRSNKSVIWHCKCDCGNECEVSTKHLMDKGVQSCGCLNSLGEMKILNIFNQNNILVEKQKTFNDCIYPDTNAKPRFDFYLPDYNRLIEFDGRQHYEEVEGWFHDSLEKRQLKDRIKNNYAHSHLIDLVRIPYTDIDTLTIDDLLGDKYLI